MSLKITLPDQRLTRRFVPACLLAVALCACTLHSGSTNHVANKTPRAASTPTDATAPDAINSEPAALSAAAPGGSLDFILFNFTGSGLHAIYLSPHDSTGWEENVLGRDELLNGEMVKIRFAPEEDAAIWDLRVEDKGGNYAEWKQLNLREISRLSLRRSENVVMAEVE